MGVVSSLTHAEQMIYSTFRVEGYKAGAPMGTGTGFYYAVDVAEERGVTLLVTNKHVIEGCDQLVFNLQIADAADPTRPSTRFERCSLRLVGDGVVPHPDASVDLCAVALNGLLEVAAEAGARPYALSFRKSSIPSPEQFSLFSAIETVKMVGCPSGLFDEVHNLPLTRQGITATPLGVPYLGKPHFVVDMACFPGSSGSPIFVQDSTGFHDPKTNTFRVGQGRFYLVGILFSGPTISSTGIISFAKPPSVEIASMMHLGYAIRSDQLLAFDNIFQGRWDEDLRNGRVSLNS